MYVTINDDAYSLAASLAKLQETGELCDVSVRSGAVEVKAHRCVLAAANDFFESRFRFHSTLSDLEEIDLSHLGCDSSVEKVIKSFYTNTIELDCEKLESVLSLADYLMYKDLTRCAERFMLSTLSVRTALLYFQLCVQYRLDEPGESTLFGKIMFMLHSRMHDYVFHQPVSLEFSLDVFVALHKFNLLSNCSVLQVVHFILTHLKTTLIAASEDEQVLKQLDASSFTSWVNFLESFWDDTEEWLQDMWRPYIIPALVSWRADNADLVSKLDALTGAVGKFEAKLEQVDPRETGALGSKSKEEPGEGQSTDSSKIQLLPHLTGNPRKKRKQCEGPFYTPLFERMEKEENADSSTALLSPDDDDSVEIQMTFYYGYKFDSAGKDLNECKRAKRLKLSKEIVKKGSSSSSQTPCCSTTAQGALSGLSQSSPTPLALPESEKTLANVLVVVTPTEELTSEKGEGGSIRRVMKTQRLQLIFYDLDFQLWRQGCTFDTPDKGCMSERHCWRMAFHKGKFYLFSLTKELGIEVDTATGTTTKLNCSNLFQNHGENLPVKSVAPISVGDHLIVLSMSRELDLKGTFYVEQHFYRYNPTDKKFEHVNDVNTEGINMPITKWIVRGNELITVKASTASIGSFQMFTVHCIHFFNADTGQVRCENLGCTLKSGLKLFLSGNLLYFLSNSGEFRAYNLATNQLGDWVSIPDQQCHLPSASTSYSGFFPALTRTTCHVGNSRWLLTCNSHKAFNATLWQTFVDEQGEFRSKLHPNPPFRTMTSISPAKVARDELDKMEQARYQIPYDH